MMLKAKTTLLDRDAYRERMFLKGLILVFTGWFLGVFLWVALQRIGYPYELEANEGIVAEGAVRILEGKPIYAEPSLEWVPFLQTPLYYYLGAGMMHLFGASIPIMRVITLIASVAIGLIIYHFLRKTGVEDFFALAGFGLYFAAYSSVGTWYDLARADMLAILFALSAVYIASTGEGWIKACWCALFAVAAFFTRQGFIFIWILLLLHWYLRGKRSFASYGISSILLIGSGLLFLHIKSSGLSWGCIFLLPLQGDLNPTRLLTFWFVDLFWKFPFMSIPAAASLFGLGRLLFRKNVKHSDSAMGVMVVGFVGVSLISRLQSCEFENALVPAAIALAGLSAWALQHFHTHEYGLGWIPPIVVKSLILFQFIVFIYRPKPKIPSQADFAAGEHLIETISALPGEVFIPNHVFYGRMAGKKTFASSANLRQLTSSCDDFSLEFLPPDIQSAVSGRRFSAVIIDEPEDPWLNAVAPYYRSTEEIFEDWDVFMPKAGKKIRPRFIFQPQ